MNEHMPGGFYGVDVFFVLSGFLITVLLLEEHGMNGHISLRRFYVRRARRLVPALVVTMVMVVAMFAVFKAYQGRLWPGLLAVAFYVGNWVEAFGHPLADGLLTPTWSLAIEEQFYILWPLALIFALRRRWSTETLFLIAFVPAVCSYAVRTILWRLPGSLTTARNAFPYGATPTHADGILLGCALAIVFANEGLRGRVAFLRRPLFPGVALAIIAAAALTDGDGRPIDWALVVLGSAVVVGHVAAVDSSAVTRFLGSRPLVWVGARSYGIYLYQVIVIALFARLHLVVPGPSPVRTFALAGATLVVAAFSYRLVETPFRQTATQTQGLWLRRRRRAAAPAPP
jgi:peptidoglycan/LPS O-acetylase OafA/YrhL